MQQPNAACTRAPPYNADLTLVLPAFGCCIPCTPVLVPKMVVTHVQLVLVHGIYISFNQLVLIFHLHYGGHHLLQLALVVFFLEALVHLLICIQTNRHILQLACGGSGYGCLFAVVVIVCGGCMWW